MSASHPRYVIERQRNPNWRAVAEACVRDLWARAESGDLMVEFRPVRRTLDQNAKQWPMLRDIASQVQISVNGTMQLISEDAWKDVATSVFQQETNYAEYGGRVIALGARTSKFGKHVFSEYIEFLYALGAEHGVKWSERALRHYELYGMGAGR